MEFKNFQNFIDYYESLDSFQWYDFCSKENVIKYLENDDKDKLKYEYLAFGFMYKKDSENIYAPFLEFMKEDWSIVWSPDRSQVDIKCIEYWNKRLEHCKSDFMKFRYSTLLLDFSISVIWKDNIKENYDKDFFYNLTNQAIDSWIVILKEKKLYHNVYGKNYIEIMIRFWELYAQKRLWDIATICISFEDDIAKDDSPWLWGFSCRYLLLNKDSHIENYLIEEQKNKIILDLNNRLKRLLKTDNVNWIEHCVELLLQYYHKSWDTKNIRHLLLCLKKVYTNKIGTLHPMILESYNENLKRLYLMYDKENKEAIDFINKENGILWKSILDSLNEFKFEVPISEKEYNDIINIYYDLENKKLKIWNFCVWMIPSREHSEQNLSKLIKDFPLQYRAVVKKYDKNWICIAEIDPSMWDKALKWQRIFQYQQEISFNFSLNKVCSLIKQNNRNENLFEGDILLECIEHEIIEKLRNLYINWKNLEFCCIAIPLIEASFRKMLQNVWWCIFVDKEWGVEYKNLHQIFDDELLKISMPNEFKDFVYYCRVILIEKHGFNLRNNLSHWLDLIGFSDDTVANRIFHILVCLSILKFVKNKK